MTITENEAQQAMLSHHRALGEGVSTRVAQVKEAVSGDQFAPATAELVAFLADEVLPHATAEERTVYQAARALPGLGETVAAMIDEHRQLVASVERLARAADGTAATAEAEAIGALFSSHVAKENEFLLPPLTADPGVDLPALLAQMHALTEPGQTDRAPADVAAAPDTESVLLGLLLDGATALADAGQGDRACRLVASAWAVLRGSRPELAVRTTAGLHRLARSATAEPVAFTSGPRHRDSDQDAELDVRSLAPAQRHEKIFATYGALGPGGAFILVNDHDPKPLRYQFAAEHAGEFTWDVLEEGPTVWRVRIGRPVGASRTSEPELDVRQFPHGQRHDVIFATYGSLVPGTGFVLVNDHDPKPLRYQFEAQHAGGYTWDYLEAGPELWRVRIGRPAGTTS